MRFQKEKEVLYTIEKDNLTLEEKIQLDLAIKILSGFDANVEFTILNSGFQTSVWIKIKTKEYNI